jgi:hypothetical protein
MFKTLKYAHLEYILFSQKKLMGLSRILYKCPMIFFSALGARDDEIEKSDITDNAQNKVARFIGRCIE